MKHFFAFLVICMAPVLMAQEIAVGDKVIVKPETTHYLTGEKISKWVYLQPHLVSQIGTERYPHAVLLDVNGANSWLAQESVSTINRSNSSVIEKDTIVLHDTITSIVEKTTQLVVRDTIYQYRVGSNEMNTSISQAHFQFYGDANLYFGDFSYGAGLDFIFGARLNEYAYVGAGTEFDYFAKGRNAVKSMQFPVFAHAKIYIPIQHKIYPYIEMSLGANMGYITSSPDEMLHPKGFYSGVYAKGGIGVDVLENLSLGIGYQYSGGYSFNNSDLHFGYVKIGFVIPK